MYTFSDFSLDLGRYQLTRNGEDVKLTKLSFNMLKTLVEAAPNMVTQDELIDRVWGENRLITPENLMQRVKTLRESLGDDAQNPQIIEVVRGKGVRLIPEVHLKEFDTAEKQGHPYWLRFAAVLVVIVAIIAVIMKFQPDQATETGALVETDPTEQTDFVPVPGATIAVLPFSNLSSDPENQFFASGFHDDLLTRISRIRDIKTISRTSVLPYRDSSKNLRTIARELGVATVLEGGVQRSGDQVRINLQLIDAETDVHLWADTYTRELTAENVFAIQSEITAAVATSLEAILSDDEKHYLEQLPTQNLQALDAYFKGIEAVNQNTTEGYQEAILNFQKAIELDPGFAEAYGRQALALLDQIWYNALTVSEQLERSRPLIDQAILLDPDSSDAYNALGKWYQYDKNTEMAEKAFRQSIALVPNNSDALANYGNLKQWSLMDSAGAVEQYQRALEIDPQSIGVKTQLAESMSMLGRGHEAIAMLEESLEDNPDFPNTHRVLADLYSWTQMRQDKAIRAMMHAYSADPGQPVFSGMLAHMYDRIGDRETAALWADNAVRLIPDPGEARIYEALALYYRGQVEEATAIFRELSLKKSSDPTAFFMTIMDDVLNGRAQQALAQFRAMAPEMESGHFTVKSHHFGIGIGYVSTLLATGDEEGAHRMGEHLLAQADSLPRSGAFGIQFYDATLYALLGNETAAIDKLGEWVDLGGASSAVLDQSDLGFSTLTDNPRYQALIETVSQRLVEQRRNLQTWGIDGLSHP